MSCIDFPQKENWTFTNNTTSCLSQDVPEGILWPPQALVLIMKERKKRKKISSVGFLCKGRLHSQSKSPWTGTRPPCPAEALGIHSFEKHLHEQLCACSSESRPQDCTRRPHLSPAFSQFSSQSHRNASTAARSTGPLHLGHLVDHCCSSGQNNSKSWAPGNICLLLPGLLSILDLLRKSHDMAEHMGLSSSFTPDYSGLASIGLVFTS